MFDFPKHVSTRLRHLQTPQAEPIPSTSQLRNSAGGFTWAVGHWTRLDRFLVLGAEGGTFYVGEREATRESASAVLDAVADDGLRVVRRTVEISESGRAPKNNPALFVLAMASNGFSVADPNDAGMLDVVGFDAATPQVISDFAA
jgi:60 kDa SS-A/Ro ribonucleoprotein